MNMTQTLGKQPVRLSTQTTRPGQRSQETTHRLEHSPRSILILEDNNTLANILRTYLESRSFAVDCVSNAADGMSQVLRKDYDIFLCEIVMPQFRGDMFFFAMERTKPYLCGRFVFLVGQQAHGASIELLKIKGSVLLRRPFLLSKLLEVIEETLKRNS